MRRLYSKWFQINNWTFVARYKGDYKPPRWSFKADIKTDWAFTIGVRVSFVAILFTFDTIAGEKQQGTLRLVLAGVVPRSSVVLGKFAGTLISISLPLIIAILLNLLIINVFGSVQLSAGHWGRIGVGIRAFPYSLVTDPYSLPQVSL
jgi:hypothetical protein